MKVNSFLKKSQAYIAAIPHRIAKYARRKRTELPATKQNSAGALTEVCEPASKKICNGDSHLADDALHANKVGLIVKQHADNSVGGEATAIISIGTDIPELPCDRSGTGARLE